MDKNTVVGLLLIFALFMGFSFYTSSKTKKVNEQAQKEVLEKMASEQVVDSTTITIMEDSLATAPEKQALTSTKHETKQHVFSSPEVADGNNYVVETNKAIYEFTKKGGYLKRVELKGIYRYTPKDSAKQPLVLYEGDDNNMNIELMLADQSIVNTKDLYFLSDQEGKLVVKDQDSTTLSIRLYPNKRNVDSLGNQCETLDYNSYVEFLYTFKPDDYRFGYKVNFVNMSSYLYANNHDFTLEWDAQLTCMEKNYEYAKNITTIFYMDNVDEVDNLDERGPEKKDFTTPLKWVSFKQQFFTSTIIANSQEFSTGLLEVTVPTDKNENSILKSMTADLEFDVNNVDNGSFDMSFYFGPNQFKLLKEYDMKLERQVPLGWGFFLLHWINRGVIIPIFNWLEAYGLNYGLIILILTVIIKIAIFPVAYKTYMSSAKMRVLKPEIETINARYPKPDDMMKKQQATMTLYKSAGVNPMSGCLPMLLQMPVLIAMFRFFPSAYELRQKSFLWADDLSTYDSILTFNFNIPFYGNHVSLFTLLMTISTLIYTWLNNKLMAPAGGGAEQQKMMKIMMYMMPVLFLGMFNSFSSALTYYYLLVNLITFFQMWMFRVTVDENKLREKIKLNMVKPIKKSKWQLKMEEIAKQQTQMAKNKR
ncbi:MAG: membrane protein insertase YidC [Bacteroidales bacterium]